YIICVFRTSKKVVALYSYSALSEDALSFAKGDAMYLLDETNTNWWYVRHSKSACVGYAPRNLVARSKVEQE
ncbi:SRC-1 protein, partial [Aphelenchoides avenae]